jgi:hypothetical protein
MSWPLNECLIVGSVCASEASAPFERDAVVLAHDEAHDVRLILGRCDLAGMVHGEHLDLAEWQGLLASNDAVASAHPISLGTYLDTYPGVPLEPVCWVLGDNYPDRERAEQELLALPMSLLHRDASVRTLHFFVNEQLTRPLLEQWSRRAFDQAWRLALRGEWALAHAQADLAWLTDLDARLEPVALLALAIEHCEGMSAAEDLIVFELNSRRPVPGAELRTVINQYREALHPGAHESPKRLAPLAARMRELEAGGRIGDLRAWRRARLAKDRVFSSTRGP